MTDCANHTHASWRKCRCPLNNGLTWALLLKSLLGLLLVAASLAHAQDHIVERGWLEDPSGQMTWQQAQASMTQPFQGTLSRGFGKSAIWLKLRIDPTRHPSPERDPGQLILRIRPVYLDDIRLYDPLAPAGLAKVTGDWQHPRQDEFQSLDFTIPIARGEAPRDVWLRLTSTSTRQIHVQALTADSLSRHTHHQALVFAGYIGLVLIFSAWGWLRWAFSREWVIGAFALAQSAALGYAFFSLGYLRSLWPADWPAWPIDRLSSVLSITAVSTALLFHVMWLREFSPPKWATWLHVAMLALWPIKLALLAMGEASIALQINLSELIWSPCVFLLSAWFAQAWRHQEQRPPSMKRGVVTAFYAILIVTLLVAALPGLGLTRGTELTLYIVQTHGLLTAFLIMLMLQYRAHRQQIQQRENALALERSQLLASKERAMREEQDQLMAMLAHELKTPLATMQMRLDPSSQGAAYIKHSIREMNGVIDRCLQATQMSDSRLVPTPGQIDLPDLLREAIANCATGPSVRLDAPDRLTITNDRQLLFVVLSNLLENACKYTTTDGTVHLKVSEDSSAHSVCLQIQNLPGAAGWPDAGKVFDKYYRSAMARRQPGSGLGLYLARHLTRALGGDLQYAPDETWVRFVMTLPCEPPAMPQRL